ncbi:hypothetical protein [Aestuariivirga sp.]|uniref:hypothetical protein n=1 Tax=Aestuariivirga sp. TaxID=2650926 RepID=UPI0039E348EB
MTGAARLFFGLAIIYAICGMALGIHMAASHDHIEMPAHAHIMVAGWVMSAIFAFFYHLFPTINASRMAMVHFWVQAVSGIVLVVSLYILLQGNDGVEPVTALASIGFLVGMLIFAWNALPVLRSKV